MNRQPPTLTDAAILGKPEGGVLPRSFAFRLAVIYVGLFIIRPWEVLFPELGAISFERMYAIFMLLCVAGTVGFRLQANRQHVAVAALCGAIGISAALALDVQTAWNAYYVFLTVVICYGVLVSVIRSPYDLLIIVVAYVGFMELYLGKALWEYFIHGRHVYKQGVTRLIGIEYTYGNFNALAGSIVISLPMWLFLWRGRELIFAEWPVRWQRWVKRALVLYPCLSVVSVLLTNSRQGMVNLFLFIFLSISHTGVKGRFFQKVVVLVLLACIGWVFIPEEQKDRVRSIWNPSAGSESAELSKLERIDAFWASMEAFERFPITGVGLDNFIVYRRRYGDGVHLESHNMFAQMLSETGLLGAAVFVFFIAALLGNCRKTIAAAEQCPEPTLRILSELARACRYSLLFLFVEGISQNNFDRFNWLWLAAFSLLAAQFASEIKASAERAENVAERPIIHEHTAHSPSHWQG